MTTLINGWGLLLVRFNRGRSRVRRGCRLLLYFGGLGRRVIGIATRREISNVNTTNHNNFDLREKRDASIPNDDKRSGGTDRSAKRSSSKASGSVILAMNQADVRVGEKRREKKKP